MKQDNSYAISEGFREKLKRLKHINPKTVLDTVAIPTTLFLKFSLLKYR